MARPPRRASRHDWLRAGAGPCRGFLDDPDRLAGLAAAAALVAGALPEREPHPDVFASFAGLIEALDSAAEWPAHYIGWERDLLAALGFGLDLSRCAVTGRQRDLAYVSPRTGRAVSRAAGLPYHDKLLALPEFLWRDGPRRPAPDRARHRLDRAFPGPPCISAAGPRSAGGAVAAWPSACGARRLDNAGWVKMPDRLGFSARLPRRTTA